MIETSSTASTSRMPASQTETVQPVGRRTLRQLNERLELVEELWGNVLRSECPPKAATSTDVLSRTSRAIARPDVDAEPKRSRAAAERRNGVTPFQLGKLGFLPRVRPSYYTRTGLAAQRRSGPERAAQPRLYHAFKITIRASSMA